MDSRDSIPARSDGVWRDKTGGCAARTRGGFANTCGQGGAGARAALNISSFHA